MSINSGNYFEIIIGSSVAVLGVIGTIMALTFSRFVTSWSESRYDENRSRVALSELRSSFENQLAELTKQLSATPDRWADINHLVLDAQGAQNQMTGLEPIGPGPFLQGLGINATHTRVDPKMVFVLTPLRDEEEDDYQAVARVCQSIDFRCSRGDEKHISGEILKHVVEQFLQARFVIANITSRNPNVFYELGVAQALGKQTILIARAGDPLSFDMQSKFVVFYKSPSEMDQPLKDAILRLLIHP